jgi:uncharacterized protein YutE (UPF0331/DUF86 family)
VTPHIAERLAELGRHLAHLREIRDRVRSAADLERDLSLHNDVLFSLLSVCQAVVDVAAELSARKGERFEDYAGAIRNLVRDKAFSEELVDQLVPLADFRNVLIHEYVALDLTRAVEALDRLGPVAEFLETVRRKELG